MYRIWNKTTCYEIYFRPLPDTSKVEVITYHNGEPFSNPMSKSHRDNSEDNVEVWDIQEARDAWGGWVNHGGYEVSEVEDYLRGGRSEWAGENINYRKESKTASWSIPE